MVSRGLAPRAVPGAQLAVAAKLLGHAPPAMRDKGEVHALVMRVIRTAHLAAAVVSRGLAPRAVRGAQLAAAAKPMHLGHAPPATRDRVRIRVRARVSRQRVSRQRVLCAQAEHPCQRSRCGMPVKRTLNMEAMEPAELHHLVCPHLDTRGHTMRNEALMLHVPI